ncbi:MULTISPECIES: P1 family peptidase [unclassified Leucobacter]|uniref:P1 family peptidase n=1 Tax=unclassified Leucobacter TaxID=2621730 RepID=UPI00165EA4A7|nr:MULTISPECIES: P1 family peptidase [unclassified Leucobacter]MBC9926450.1 P1 family peptidase [Leucobacter sp. cx-169]
MTANSRPRLADLGIGPGPFPRGELNAITDVAGVEIGHATIAAHEINSGVTAIVPRQLSAERRTLPAGLAVGNGYGKLIGATQIQELGSIETPILLTSTLSAFRAADALVTEVLAQPWHAKTTTLNPVVGETNDGFLSHIRDRPVTGEHLRAALAAAASGPVAEGAVGAGAGTTALGFKGGIGTASRVVAVGSRSVTVGVLVQSNFTGLLRIAGVPMPSAELVPGPTAETVGNSCMIVVALDAPFDGRQLSRIARRAVIGMRGVGADFSNGSGDYAIAFTTGAGESLADDHCSGLFHATMLAVEEALINSILRAETRTGPEGRVAHGIPVDAVRERLERAGVTGLE